MGDVINNFRGVLVEHRVVLDDDDRVVASSRMVMNWKQVNARRDHQFYLSISQILRLSNATVTSPFALLVPQVNPIVPDGKLVSV